MLCNVLKRVIKKKLEIHKSLKQNIAFQALFARTYNLFIPVKFSLQKLLTNHKSKHHFDSGYKRRKKRKFSNFFTRDDIITSTVQPSPISSARNLKTCFIHPDTYIHIYS